MDQVLNVVVLIVCLIACIPWGVGPSRLCWLGCWNGNAAYVTLALVAVAVCWKLGVFAQLTPLAG